MDCKGIYKSFLRIMKCNPWFGHGGYDPVKKRKAKINVRTEKYNLPPSLYRCNNRLYTLFLLHLRKNQTKQIKQEKVQKIRIHQVLIKMKIL